jgi:hypothetical protein
MTISTTRVEPTSSRAAESAPTMEPSPARKSTSTPSAVSNGWMKTPTFWVPFFVRLSHVDDQRAVVEPDVLVAVGRAVDPVEREQRVRVVGDGDRCVSLGLDGRERFRAEHGADAEDRSAGGDEEGASLHVLGVRLRGRVDGSRRAAGPHVLEPSGTQCLCNGSLEPPGSFSRGA